MNENQHANDDAQILFEFIKNNLSSTVTTPQKIPQVTYNTPSSNMHPPQISTFSLNAASVAAALNSVATASRNTRNINNENMINMMNNLNNQQNEINLTNDKQILNEQTSVIRKLSFM